MLLGLTAMKEYSLFPTRSPELESHQQDTFFWRELRQQLHKNAASNIEQALEAAPNKAAVVWPHTTHHEKISKSDEPDMRDTA